MKAANDNLSPAGRMDVLQARAFELKAAFEGPAATPEIQAAAMLELRDIVDEMAAIRRNTEAEVAALTRQILQLGGRTIRRVATDADGNPVVF